MNYDTDVLHIMYGLPGSGKTTLAMDIYNYYDNSKDNWEKDNVVYFCFDKQEDYLTFQNFPIYGTMPRDVSTILDGYAENMKKLIEKYNIFIEKASFKLNSHSYDKVIIHNFIPNEEACIFNDMGRRDKDAQITIKKGIEPFSIETFRTLAVEKGYYWFNSLDIEVENHTVEKYENRKNSINFLISKWEYEPELIGEFKELDNYLEINYPKCTFLQYKKIKKMVERIEEESWDYYDKENTISVMYKIAINDIKKIMEE